MKQAKRILSLLLSLCLVLGLIPGTAFAAGGNLPFTDVNTTDWFYDAVQYAYEKGMMSGTSTTTFSPGSTTTRGMIVTILHRMEGTPAANGTDFTDVSAGQWYSNAVSWASANGIVSGYGNGLFGPSDPITREQMAAILNRYSTYKGYDAGTVGSITGFSDASQVSAYAVEPMGWAIGNGLISGVGNNTLAPKGNATRAQVATILKRFCENIADKANTAPETPVDKTYTVTFDLNYGSNTRYDEKTVKEGETVSKPSNPTRSGYSFSGWYAEKSGGRQFDFKTGITSDLTLYAHWSSNSSSGGGSSGSGGGGYVPPVTPSTPPSDGDDEAYTTAEEYIADHVAQVIEIIPAATSPDVMTEAEAKNLLEDRGFRQKLDQNGAPAGYPITYDYNISGTYTGETSITSSTTEKHPMYQTMYRSSAGEMWAVYVVNDEVFANPLSFNLETSGLDAELLVSESEQFTSYDDRTNTFYVNIPKTTSVFTQQVQRIDAETLDGLTIASLCTLTGASPLASAETVETNEIAPLMAMTEDEFAAYSPNESADYTATAVAQASGDATIVVSLGDSYSSGEGIPPFIGQNQELRSKIQDPDWLAHRSANSWPSQIEIPGTTGTMANYRVETGRTSQADVQWYFGAVSGAETWHFSHKQSKQVKKEIESNFFTTTYLTYADGQEPKLEPQLDIFDRIDRNDVDYVTLTIGGNDVDFAGVVTLAAINCAHLHFGSTSALDDRLTELWNNIDNTMSDIKDVYIDISNKAPNATILVAGYPKLFNRDGKGLLINKLEARMINEKVSAFNDKIDDLVTNCRQGGKNIWFVDVESAFDGHEAYSSDNWLNPIWIGAKSEDLNDTSPSAYSVHPNDKGAQAYARCVNAKIRSLEDSVKTLFGYITIADADTDMTNNLPLPGAKITLTKAGLLPTVYSTETGRDGRYSIDNLPSGEYVILVTADGYIPVTGRITITDDLQNQYDAMVEAIPYGIFGGEGTASGTVIDVITGCGVAGLTLNIRKGINVISGEIAATVVTGADGSYATPTLEAGNYSVEVIDGRTLDNEAARYLTSVFIIKVLGNHSIPNQNGSVTNGLAADQLRIVLQWGEQPRDLDSHLVGPAVGGGEFHVYFSDRRYEAGSNLMADLDLDDTSSYGPETTTIYEMSPGVYTYMIHDYTNRRSGSSTALSSSGAYVEVYLGTSTTAAYTFYVPSGGGTLWTVFNYDARTGTITPINTMSYRESPSTVGSEYSPENAIAAQVLIEEPLKDYEIAELQNNAEDNTSQGNQLEPEDTGNFEEDIPSIDQQGPGTADTTETGNVSQEPAANAPSEAENAPEATTVDMSANEAAS